MHDGTSVRRGEPALTGPGLLLATSVIWGTTGAAQQLADVEASAPVVGSIRLVVGAIVLLAVTLAMGGHRTLARMFAPRLWRWTISAGATALASPRGLLLTGWVGVVATAGAYVLFARGLTRTRAATAGTLSLAEPLTAAVLGVILLAERPSGAGLAGACLLALGLALTAVLGGTKPTAVSRPIASPA